MPTEAVVDTGVIYHRAVYAPEELGHPRQPTAPLVRVAAGATFVAVALAASPGALDEQP
jgi:hypothetical protein